MRERLHRILEELLNQDDFLPVPVLAARIGAGIRTVFRDVLELERYLRDYGLSIEKKRSAGIRLTGDASRLRGKAPAELSRLSWLTVTERQSALLVFLGLKARIVKLNELATLFSVSDSCISTDLKEEDDFLRRTAPKASLVRLKGIGVLLEGGEWDVRMAVLRSAAMLIHPQELIQMLLFRKENGKLEKTMRLLGFSSKKNGVLDAIRETEKRIGYRFSWHDLALLFLYLLIALERKSCGHKSPTPEFSDIPMSVSLSTARLLWNALAGEDMDAPGDAAESLWLRGILSSLEPGEIRETARSHPDIPKTVSRMIAEMGTSNCFTYDFDSRLYSVLQASMSSLVYKKLIGFPVSPPLAAPDTLKDALDEHLFGILSPLLADTFAISVTPEEIEPLCMTIRTSDGTLALIRPKLRLLVTCFGGICLAQFIASTIRANFPDVTVVAALSCDRVSDAYLEENRIDLVITTFPAGLVSASEYVVSIPFEIDTFRAEIGALLSGFAAGSPAQEKTPDCGGNADDRGDIDISLSILQRFSLTVIPGPVKEGEITALLARAAVGDRKEYIALKRDFDIRESFGAVTLEESGIRFFHCRSPAVDEPVAGVLRVLSSRETFVYLAAPDPASADAIQALSKISIALMEDKNFTHALVHGGEGEIKRRLFGFLASTL